MFSCARNNLSELPDSMAQLVELQFLNIEDNALEEFPAWMDSFPKLERLWCSHNKLKIVPSSFRNLSSLYLFHGNDNPWEDYNVLFEIPKVYTNLCSKPTVCEDRIQYRAGLCAAAGGALLLGQAYLFGTSLTDVSFTSFALTTFTAGAVATALLPQVAGKVRNASLWANRRWTQLRA